MKLTAYYLFNFYEKLKKYVYNTPIVILIIKILAYIRILHEYARI